MIIRQIMLRTVVRAVKEMTENGAPFSLGGASAENTEGGKEELDS